MGRTVGELQASLSVHELRYWYAFDEIEPVGLQREDTLFGALAMNVVTSQEHVDGSDLTVGDFMLYQNLETHIDNEPDYQLSVQESVENVKAFFSAMKV